MYITYQHIFDMYIHMYTSCYIYTYIIHYGITRYILNPICHVKCVIYEILHVMFFYAVDAVFHILCYVLFLICHFSSTYDVPYHIPCIGHSVPYIAHSVSCMFSRQGGKIGSCLPLLLGRSPQRSFWQPGHPAGPGFNVECFWSASCPVQREILEQEPSEKRVLGFLSRVFSGMIEFAGASQSRGKNARTSKSSCELQPQARICRKPPGTDAAKPRLRSFYVDMSVEISYTCTMSGMLRQGCAWSSLLFFDVNTADNW